MNSSHSGLPNVTQAETSTNSSGGQTISVSFDQDTFVPPDALVVSDSQGTSVDLSNAEYLFDPLHRSVSWDLSLVGLSSDSYTYSIRNDAIQGIDGFALDGNSDGIAGDDFLGKLNVGVGSSQLEILAFEVNEADSDYSQLSTVTVEFSRDVGASLDASDLVLHASEGEATFVPLSVEFDDQTNRAVWMFDSAAIPAGYYVAVVDGGGVEDSLGNQLRGDFDLAGTDYRRTLLVANLGDLNLDGAVKPAEAATIINAVDASWSDGDLTGNGVVDPLDALVAIQYVGSVSIGVQPAPPAAVIGSTFESLHGDEGNDHFIFHTPKGSVDNRVFDSEGRDTVYFNRVNYEGVSIDLRQETQTLRGPKPADELTLSFELDVIENVVGSPYADVLIGNSFANVLSGMGGSDELIGLAGDDDLLGGAGNDTYRFSGNTMLGYDYIREAPSAGDDTIDFSGLSGQLQYSSQLLRQPVGELLTLATDDYGAESASIEHVTPSTIVVTPQGPFVVVIGAHVSWNVASFVDSLHGGLASDYEAIIDWGDGHTESGEITKNGNEFVVRGEHQYASEATFQPTVTVRGRGGDSLTYPLQVEFVDDVVFSDDGVIADEILGAVDIDLSSRWLQIRTAQEHRRAQNAVLEIHRSSNVFGGSFQLRSNGQSTALLPWDASAGDIRDAMSSSFAEFEQDDLSVTSTSRGWHVEFTGAWATQTPPEIFVDETGILATPHKTREIFEEVTVQLTPTWAFSGSASQQFPSGGTFSFSIGASQLLTGPLSAFASDAELQSLIDTQLGDSPIHSQIQVVPSDLGTANSLSVTMRREVTASPADSYQNLNVHFDDPPDCNPTAFETVCPTWLRTQEVRRESHFKLTPAPVAGSFEAFLDWFDDSSDKSIGVHPFDVSSGALSAAMYEQLDDSLEPTNAHLSSFAGWGYHATADRPTESTLEFVSEAMVITHVETGELFLNGVDVPPQDLPTNIYLPIDSTFYASISDIDLAANGGVGTNVGVGAELIQPAYTPLNEIQRIFIPRWFSGEEFVLHYDDQDIVVPVVATAAELQNSLESLIGSGNVAVSTRPASEGSYSWEVEFIGDLAEQNVPNLRPTVWAELSAEIDWDLDSADPALVTVGELNPAGPFLVGHDYTATVAGSYPLGSLPPGSHDIEVTVVDSALEPYVTGRTKVIVANASTMTLTESFTPGRQSSFSLDELGVEGGHDLVVYSPHELVAWNVDSEEKTLRLIPEHSASEDIHVNIGSFEDGLLVGIGRIRLELDSDGDGLLDRLELGSTDPFAFDTDGDLLGDGFEVRAATAAGLDPNEVDDAFADPDGDFLSNLDEQIYGTNAGLADSDGDGISDYQEVTEFGSDPNDGNDFSPITTGSFPLEINIGDPSGSHSERWQLNLGPISHVSPDFGVMSGWVRYQVFEEGETYDLSLLHQGSKYETPDFDWGADVRVPEDREGAVYIEEVAFPGESAYPLIGFHDPSSTDETLRNVARVYIPKVDLDIVNPDGSLVDDEEEKQSGQLVAINNDDDDGNDGFDFEDGLVRGENDLLQLKIAEVTPAKFSGGEITLTFDSDKVKLWRTSEKTGEIISGETRLRASKEHTVYVEGIEESSELNDVEIKAKFILAEEGDYIVRGSESTDTVKLAVISFDLDIDSDNDEGFTIPEQNSDWEDELEENDYGLGKLVIEDGPNVPFTPMKLRLTSGLDSEAAKVRVRLDFEPATSAGIIHLWTVPKDHPSPDSTGADAGGHRVYPGDEYTLDQLNYDSSAGEITLFIQGVDAFEGIRQLSGVETNGKPQEFIKATLVSIAGESVDLASDRVRFLVTGESSFFYRLQNDVPGHKSQTLRHSLAARGVYLRSDDGPTFGNSDLREFSMESLDAAQMRRLRVPEQVIEWIENDGPNHVDGFEVALYRDYIAGERNYILAFAGTDEFADVISDIWQGVGFDDRQYLRAMQIASNLAATDAFAGRFTITGHSLGGGLASGAAVVSGVTADTFNAAGLRLSSLLVDGNEIFPGSVARYNNAAALIDAYFVDYDLLSGAQDAFPGVQDAIGSRIRMDGPFDMDMAENFLLLSALLASGATTGQAWLGFVAAAPAYADMIQSHVNSTVLYGHLVTEGGLFNETEDLLGYEF